MDDDPAAFRLFSVLLVIASALYIVPQVYGMEAADQAYLGDLPNALISTGNLALARSILWVSLALFVLTAGRRVRPVPDAPRPARRRRGIDRRGVGPRAGTSPARSRGVPTDGADPPAPSIPFMSMVG